MPGPARIVLPGYPHHVVQRGNLGQPTFLEDEDDGLYRQSRPGVSRRAGADKRS
jgi:hypothetical protein